MHAHLEIVMPPVDDIEAAVEQILKDFDEQGEDEDGNANSYGFWDWYVIGGRWAGAKLEFQLGEDKIKEFRALLNEKGVTVSGFQAGKPALQPASQIEVVDALWNEYFPNSPLKQCPLFAHSNNQYDKVSGVVGDIMKFGDIDFDFTAERIIFAKPSYSDEKILQAGFMLQQDAYNGCNFMKTDWNGKFSAAKERYLKSIETYKNGYKEKYTPTDEWLVVTVDYHS